MNLAHPLMFFVFFAVMWTAVTFLLSMFSGWRALASSYETLEGFPAENKWISIGMGRFWFFRVSYSNCVKLSRDGRSSYWQVLLPFRLGHPPLCIPLADFSAENRRFLWYHYVRLRADLQRDVFINISAKHWAWLSHDA